MECFAELGWPCDYDFSVQNTDCGFESQQDQCLFWYDLESLCIVVSVQI